MLSSVDPDICNMVQMMLQEGDYSTIVQMDLSHKRFDVDVEINILRVEDRETNKEVFMKSISKYCDDRPDAVQRVH